MIWALFLAISFSQGADFQEYWNRRIMINRLDQVTQSGYSELSSAIDDLFQSLIIQPSSASDVIWTSFPSANHECGEVRTRYRRSLEYFDDLFLVLEEIKQFSKKFSTEPNFNKRKEYQKKMDSGLKLVGRNQIRLTEIYDLDSEYNNIMLLWKTFLAEDETLVSVELQKAYLPTGTWLSGFSNIPINISHTEKEISIQFPQPFSISCFKSDPVLFELGIQVKKQDQTETRNIWFGSKIPVMR